MAGVNGRYALAGAIGCATGVVLTVIVVAAGNILYFWIAFR